MKHNKSLVEKISIKDSTPAKSRKGYEVRSNLEKLNVRNDSRILSNSQRSGVDNDDDAGDQERQVGQIEQTIPDDVKHINQEQMRNDQQEKEDEKQQNLQEEKIHLLENNFSWLSVSVSNIKNQYSQLKQSESKILLSTKTTKSKLQRKMSKLDHPHIFGFLIKKQQEQQIREKRRLDDVAKLEKIKVEKQEAERNQKQQEKQEKINQLKKQWFVKEKNQQLKEQQCIKQKQSEEIFKKYRNSIPLFEIKEKITKQEESKKVELMKQYLKKHKQTYMSVHQGYKENHLEEHNKKHDEKLAQLDKQKAEEKISVFQKIQKDNEGLKNLYRGKVSERVVEEIKEKDQKKEIPYRIRERVKGYEDFVKQNYKPKLRESKLRQIRSNSSSLDLKVKRDNDSHLSFREIKRYKYIHGVSYGQIVEQRPMAKSYEDSNRAGNGYLQFMKSLPKKRKSPEQNAQQQLMRIPIPKSPRSNPLLHNRKRNPIISINSEPTRDEINMVLQQLRQNDKKLKEKEKIAQMKGHRNEEMDSDRRQINDELLLSVEKKMDLLHKLEKNKVRLDDAVKKKGKCIEQEDY